jgi:hypothetical protein
VLLLSLHVCALARKRLAGLSDAHALVRTSARAAVVTQSLL